MPKCIENYNVKELSEFVRQEERSCNEKKTELENRVKLLEGVSMLLHELEVKEEELQQYKEQNEKLEGNVSKLSDKVLQLEDQLKTQKEATPKNVEEIESKAIAKVFNVLLRYSFRWRPKRKEAAYNVLHPVAVLDYVPKDVKEKIEALSDNNIGQLADGRQATIAISGPTTIQTQNTNINGDIIENQNNIQN